MRGRRPQNLVAAAQAMETPAPPSWFDRHAKAEWKRVAPILTQERKVLTTGDVATLQSYCIAVGQVAQAAEIISKEGLTFNGPHGPRKHPAVAIQQGAMAQARLLAGELGLTPTSRSRPAMRDDDDADTLVD
ncbi:phage terminase small subunit P27 family [Ancylobacter sp. WKF20]|uniref:phage terminase small subunit P27 family n=1 Tax=Ancylobacter sp. WKF20 TaxID=3039801 RepID=UPI0024344AA1|nr:phage terminase small subunit P27 family [Ancylobacter sp. WKF20]WGD32009.1 phage terminase small subunit P27 family [Ancylobacter sp. WKF20]